VKVLITGANGFIGRHLIRTLLDAGHELVATRKSDTEVPADWPEAVQVFPLDLCDAESVARVVDSRPEAIIHLAAIAFSRDAYLDPGLAWNVNAGGTARVLAAVRDLREKTGADPLVILASSSEVYGHGRSKPRLESEAPNPLNIYGATKLGAEIAASQSREEWGLRVITVRPFPATGPGYQENRILSKWIRALRAGEKVVEGDPTVVRDYMDVRDAARGYLAILLHGRVGETYNLARGAAVTFGELFAMLASMLQSDARLEAPEHPRRDAHHLVGDISKIHKHTGWQPVFELERTLSDLITDQSLVNAQTD
jgi:nucleoside-diphosphate-sugar epimerase